MQKKFLQYLNIKIQNVENKTKNIQKKSQKNIK